MKGFYWYHVISMLSAMHGILQIHIIGNINFANFINNVTIFFHYSFLSFFIIKVIGNPILKCYLGIIFGLFFLAMLIFQINTDIFKIRNVAFSIANCGLVLFSLVYYLQLFKGEPNINLLKEPSFWIISGIFISNSLLIPSNAASDYFFLDLKVSNGILVVLNFIRIIPIYIFHLFLIKGHLCATTQRMM